MAGEIWTLLPSAGQKIRNQIFLLHHLLLLLFLLLPQQIGAAAS